MPRVARRSVGGLIYHVLNRANARRTLFRTPRDYQAFLEVLLEALGRFPGVTLLAFCVMPNHFHLVLRPSRDGELSRFMRWLTQTHTQRWRHAHRTVGYGALYQGRFKAFVVQDDHHFLILCRYVERNALRARLCRRAEAWPWGSAAARAGAGDAKVAALLGEWPLPRPANWSALLNRAQRDEEESAVRTSIRRGRPLGDEKWMERMVSRLGLGHTLRPRGRPRGSKDRRPRRRPAKVRQQQGPS